MSAEPIRILLVDDDEVDREAVARGVGASGMDCNITVAENGVQALRLLRESNAASPLAPPFVILLDINMPQMDGFEFLDDLRADRKLRDCVVFTLTTSTRAADKAAAYRRNVAAYIPKSSVGENCVDLVSLIRDYWRVSELPG